MFTAAKLIAPVMDKKDWEAGYDWVVETIKLDHEYLASKMEVEKALHYLKTKEFDKVGGQLHFFDAVYMSHSRNTSYLEYPVNQYQVLGEKKASYSPRMGVIPLQTTDITRHDLSVDFM